MTSAGIVARRFRRPVIEFFSMIVPQATILCLNLFIPLQLRPRGPRALAGRVRPRNRARPAYHHGGSKFTISWLERKHYRSLTTK
jgi:hypothetical protein